MEESKVNFNYELDRLKLAMHKYSQCATKIREISENLVKIVDRQENNMTRWKK